MDLANNIVNNLLDIIKEQTLEKAVLQARLDSANAAKQELETKAAELERTILDISKPVEEED